MDSTGAVDLLARQLNRWPETTLQAALNRLGWVAFPPALATSARAALVAGIEAIPACGDPDCSACSEGARAALRDA